MAYFGTDIAEVFVLSQLFFQHLRVCGKDGQRGLQFVTRIPDELPLLVERLLYGAQRAANQQRGERGKQRAGSGARDGRDAKKRAHITDFRTYVHCDDQRAVFARFHPVSLRADAAFASAARSDTFRQRGNERVVIQISAFGFPFVKLARFCQANNAGFGHP